MHRIIMKQQEKNEQIKRKQTCSLCFENVFKFKENKFKIVQRILGNKNNINKKKLLMTMIIT